MDLYLIFDGGNGATKEKIAYGSFKIKDSKNGALHTFEHVMFEAGYTSNEAEYLTLIAALQFIVLHYSEVNHINLEIEGDSELIRCQIGEYEVKHIGTFTNTQENIYILEWKGWKIKAEHLEKYRYTARGLFLQFNSFAYNHIPRKEVVAELGH